MNSDKKEKSMFTTKKKIGQHVLDLKKFETSVPRPVHRLGQMPGASLESVLQHIVSELSVATSLLGKHANRTCRHSVSARTMGKVLGSQ